MNQPNELQTSDPLAPVDLNTQFPVNLMDIEGFIDIINFIPSFIPKKVKDQLKIYHNGTDWKLYFYDNVSGVWGNIPLIDPNTAQFNANKLQGNNVSSDTPNVDDSLIWDGTNWASGAPKSFEMKITASGMSQGDLVSYIPSAENALIYQFDTDAITAWDFGKVSSEKLGFHFKAPIDFTLKTLSLLINKGGSPTGSVVMKIYDGGVNGTLIAQNTQTPANFPTLTEFTFNLAITQGADVWISVERTTALSDNNYWKLYMNYKVSSISDYHPDTIGLKYYTLGSWLDNSIYDTVIFKVYGDYTAGYYKWLGYRTNINFEPFLGVVKSAVSDDVTLTLSGYLSGFSDLTKGTLYKIHDVVVGQVLSPSSILVFSKKYIYLLDLIFTVTDDNHPLNLPLGWIPTSYVLNNLTKEDGIGAEIVLRTTNTVSSSLKITNEYTAL